MDIKEIIERAGGAVYIAQELGISHQAVYKWTKVPADKVLIIARMSGVTPEQIRPDVFGEAA